ncbi:hypothetical protein [Clostridium sp. D53t1_180928_C8]|uniref:hypothetical protein n=1 Tax=Clostridium sp. D53t1_180928_C8 TaxID=2787101 RepID=UPI0018AA93D5|nr:hypothetical protein [Clostridium sp. D53t1_180928_C8]
MTKKELMIKAHKMAKEIKNEYPTVDYKFQLGLCLAYLYENEGDVKMVELKGSEKQIVWAEEIREVVLEMAERTVEGATARYNEKQNKARTRRMNETIELLEKFKNEESAKFFIDNFKGLLNTKKELIKVGIEDKERLACEYVYCLERL